MLHHSRMTQQAASIVDDQQLEYSITELCSSYRFGIQHFQLISFNKGKPAASKYIRGLSQDITQFNAPPTILTVHYLAGVIDGNFQQPLRLSHSAQLALRCDKALTQ